MVRMLNLLTDHSWKFARVSSLGRTWHVSHVSLNGGRLNSACWELSLVFPLEGEGGGAWAESNKYHEN